MARGVRCALQYGISERPWGTISLQDWEWGCCLNNGGRSLTRRRVWIFADVRWVMYRLRCVHSSWSYRSQRQPLWQLLSYITNKNLHFSVWSGNARKRWQMWLRPPPSPLHLMAAYSPQSEVVTGCSAAGHPAQPEVSGLPLFSKTH